jgi:hypothetical protein
LRPASYIEFHIWFSHATVKHRKVF